MVFAAMQQWPLARRVLDRTFTQSPRTLAASLYGEVMSNLIPEQLVTTQKVGLERLFGLTAKAFGSIEKLAELNLQVVKSTFAENQELLTKALSSNYPQSLFALPVGIAQPAVEKAVSYGRQVSEIMSSAQGEFSEATAALVQQYQRDAQVLVEQLAKNTPAGCEDMVAAWKSAISTASATYETVKKATKQVAQVEAVGK
jgi:phasin family protein